MKVVTLGEIMLRLSTPGYSRFVQSQQFDVTYGGGEANVAVALANYGFESYFVTKLPKHEIGQSAVNHLRRFGVSDRFIVRGGDRVGIYFLETGASQRSSKVIYDRADAAVTTLAPNELDFDAIFEGARWFHWTGITPALGETVRGTLVEACKAARAAGVDGACPDFPMGSGRAVDSGRPGRHRADPDRAMRRAGLSTGPDIRWNRSRTTRSDARSHHGGG